MKLDTKRLAWALLPWTVASSPFPAEERLAVPDGSTYANHIFNALHNSMKMFGSVMQHNGMSVFIATVPEGTEFYHGTSSAYRINGTEWLAFEPEHAMAFAHPGRIRRQQPYRANNLPLDDEERGSTGKSHDKNWKGSVKHANDFESETGSWVQDHARHREHVKPYRAGSRDKHQKESLHQQIGSDSGNSGWTQDHARHREHMKTYHADSRVKTKHHKVDMTAESAAHRGLFTRQWKRLQSMVQYFLTEQGESRRILVEEFDTQALHASHDGHHNKPGRQSQSDIEEHQEQSSSMPTEPTAEEQTGYFHTYRTKRELRLVYFDGQSAAKSLKGTLDMQDIVLRNATLFDGSPAEGDDLRADDLCAMARDQWDNRVDGFIRMVGGFEVILCSFADNLDVVSILSTYPSRDGDGGSHLSYARALATRFDGIGGGRVSINYDDFVTMFAYPDAMYFDEQGLPRVVDDAAKLGPVRAHIDRLVRGPDATAPSINWQNVVDMIMTRYQYRISLALSPAISTHHELRRGLHLAIEPFIDARARNSTAEIERCAKQFWVSGADTTTVPAQAVSRVSERLCSSLVAGASAETYEEGIAIIEELKHYLDWAVFRECNKCKIDEVCQLPIWPSGSKEDFVRPRCGTGLAHGSGGYWDMMGKIRQH
ncbi:hypothetical protein AtubIFM56815_005497 [Aspergillus tubingensis]|uniref:Uncharacterized protein n=2 Tax=Aspergillus subgen. Circumdati TaxID=2720871 RepID=A0A100I7H4_ASPNG|nr:uncharacterized protein AtWU_04124 [Aspergillus tubingensis]GAQ36114.1 hypothetical protein AKAW_04789 [Aspergillus niger]GFN14324.1 hypothetical protein AtWU_04124 [Aspergillus tubingensis]GLA63922.1 hypothetical protein AtubIFM54640_005084 [Aspergillus tubingensis]GLA89953.1 hypothetical protein AtubIFM56815_005497 [Aspergillus tubingensis]GLB12982.1 hypothetical protein AtubIFM61612_000376 [Aspergillus tubingensis]